MTTAFAASASDPSPLPLAGIDPDAAYRPGVCNIGPKEIARRRRTGHVGLIATIGLFAVLVAVGAPPIARAVVGLPAVIAASGYLQAWLKFCAGYASVGMFNFGGSNDKQAVADDASRALDRAMARRISLTTFAVGVVVAIVAVALPL